MTQRSSIEWTDSTWNPVRGCTKISTGCKHCYAERFAERWRGIEGHPYERGFDLRLVPERLFDPLLWSQSRTIFVNSMSDLFHESVPEEYIRAVFEIMALADWHVYQVLTKRSTRMRKIVSSLPSHLQSLPHIWLGVSVENKKHGVPRINVLRQTPASVRFLSVEPLLADVGQLNLRGIHWVIVGGESGPGARPMQRSWVVSVRRQCRAAKVPFFFKQWGGIHKKHAGRTLDGRTYSGMPPLCSTTPPDGKGRIELLKEARDSFICSLAHQLTA